VFEAFRKEVLALDPCVSEEFMKLYVAYKAETNFVDVVPQAKRLRLSINMTFAEINDPKGLCRDITNISRAYGPLGSVGRLPLWLKALLIYSRLRLRRRTPGVFGDINRQTFPRSSSPFVLTTGLVPPTSGGKNSPEVGARHER